MPRGGAMGCPVVHAVAVRRRRVGHRGPGVYNVRCQARGRDLSYDLAVDEAEEDYLLEFWPAASTGERLPGAAAKRT